MFPECASKTPCNHVMCVLCVFCHLARCSPPAETEAAAADVFATEVGEKKATVQEESAKACFVFSALGGWGKAIRLLNHGIGSSMDESFILCTKGGKRSECGGICWEMKEPPCK